MARSFAGGRSESRLDLDHDRSNAQLGRSRSEAGFSRAQSGEDSYDSRAFGDGPPRGGRSNAQLGHGRSEVGFSMGDASLDSQGFQSGPSKGSRSSAQMRDARPKAGPSTAQLGNGSFGTQSFERGPTKSGLNPGQRFESGASFERGPPKTILSPVPPPAAPPPAVRSMQASDWRASSPLPKGFSSPARANGSPGGRVRAAPSMGAPVVPQHRNEVLHKMLRGLEDDSLTVSDVLGVLETELRSGAPAAAPLTEQFEHYGIVPHGGSSPAPNHSCGTPFRPQPWEMSKYTNDVRSRTPNGNWQEQGQDPPSHVLLGCARCAVLEAQVQALAQSLSGLGARMFNWSLAHCKENNERNGMWHLIVKYLQPVMTVDERISETCSGLLAACGTTGGNFVSPEVTTNKRGGRPLAFGGAQARTGSASPGPVWQPPGLSATAAGAGGFASPGRSHSPGRGHSKWVAAGGARKFAENPLHMAPSKRAFNPDDFNADGYDRDLDHHDMKSLMTQEFGDSDDEEIDAAQQLKRIGNHALTIHHPHSAGAAALCKRGSGLQLWRDLMGYKRPQEYVEPPPPPKDAPDISIAQSAKPPYDYVPKERTDPAYAAAAFQYYANLLTNCSVRFGASRAAKRLNGLYELVPGAKINGRQMYANGKLNLMYLSDGCWVIKLGPTHDLDADVFAYVRDDANVPWRIKKRWNVCADGDGFVLDERGATTPGKSQTNEAIHAASEEARKTAGLTQHGMKAETALMDRVDREELQQFRIAKNMNGMLRYHGATLPDAHEFHDFPGASKIKITIVKAMGLRKADLLTPTDAFVICEVPGKGAVGQTRVVKDSQTPVWNHEMFIRYTPGDKLRFSVWDWDYGRKSDLLCDTILPASHFYPNGFHGALALNEYTCVTKATVEVIIEIMDAAPDPREANIMSPDKQRLVAKDFIALQNKIEAAEAREKALRTKYEEEKMAREIAQEQAEEATIAAAELIAHQAHLRQGLNHHLHDPHGEDEEEDPEIAELRDVFERYNTDGTGTINLQEMCELMYDLGFGDLNVEELEVMIDRADEGSVALDFDEVLNFVDQMNQFGGDGLAKYELMFNRFDHNNDGYMTTEEVDKLIWATGKTYQQEELNRLMREYDTSGDGRIMWEEFILLVQKLESGTLVKHKAAVVDLTDSKPEDRLKLASSDKKRIRAYLKRRGFPGERLELSEAVNQRKKKGLLNKHFEYPLHTAAVDNLADMVWLLLLSGADKDLRNHLDKTAYEAAAEEDKGKGTHKKVMEYLFPADQFDEDF